MQIRNQKVPFGITRSCVRLYFKYSIDAMPCICWAIRVGTERLDKCGKILDVGRKCSCDQSRIARKKERIEVRPNQSKTEYD